MGPQSYLALRLLEKLLIIGTYAAKENDRLLIVCRGHGFRHPGRSTQKKILIIMIIVIDNKAGVCYDVSNNRKSSPKYEMR